MAQEYWIVSHVARREDEDGNDLDLGVADSNIVIKAGTKAQVRQHILGKYKITPASKEMLVDLLTAGCKVESVADEVAGDEPAGEGKS